MFYNITLRELRQKKEIFKVKRYIYGINLIYLFQHTVMN
ncbi:hypothetical protein HMPREF1173_01704 [Prevotella nigrescens CC14M]|uniref:Uncharacterized protein n=1 Tax=Prevotella nigrescens CC14M TaxID=1073366 RepID=V8CNE4_9BACT|nr:hypothetical protein HMPREF1173_01704 [Prevotella nigrescens CC14M]